MRFLRYRRQNRQGVLVGFILLALIPRLIYLASIPREGILESVDAQGYDLLAQNLGAGHGFSLQNSPPYQPDGLRTPLYPVFVASIYALIGEHPIAVAISQAILESVTALIVGAVAAALLGKRAGVAAAIIYALTPVQWRYTSALLPEVLLAFLVALSVWLLTRTLVTDRQLAHRHVAANLRSADSNIPSERSTLGRDALIPIAVACGAVAGLAALTKPNAAALALILATGAILALRSNRRKAVAVAGAIILAAVAVTGPWLIRNWATFGRPFLSNTGMGYIARVTAPATLGVVEDHQVPPWSHEWEARYHGLVAQAATRFGWRLEPATTLSPREADRRERQIAQTAGDILLAHPWEALQAHFVGCVRSWAPQEQTFWYSHLSGRAWEETGVGANSYRDAIEILLAGRPVEAFEFGITEPWKRLDALGGALWYSWGLGHMIGIGLMTIGVWRLRQRPALALAMAVTVLYATLPAGPIGYVRFRVPVMPLITVLEVAGFVLLTSKLRSLSANQARDIVGSSKQRSEK